MQVTLEIKEKHFIDFINFIETIDYIKILESDMPTEKGKAYDVSQIRKVYKNAYEPWTETGDRMLQTFFESGKSIEELSEIFERNKGAIQARINKLGLAYGNDGD